ncbi:MAG: hypothetical protein KAT65_23305, partial [Methanophagales archaeon]|nr:hypothetical protein [Methanophagales archaeon]
PILLLQTMCTKKITNRYLSPNDGGYQTELHRISLSVCSGFGSNSERDLRLKLVIPANTRITT